MGFQLLGPAQATRLINAWAGGDKLHVKWTDHAKERLAERDLTTIEGLRVLQSGFVYEAGKPGDRTGEYKYLVEGSAELDGPWLGFPVQIRSEHRVVVITAMRIDEKKWWW